VVIFLRSRASQEYRYIDIADDIIIIIMEKTEAGLRGLYIREIDVKSQILVT